MKSLPLLARIRTWPLAASVACTVFAASPTAHAQYHFLGQLAVFAGSYCPRHWAPAAGQILAVSTNQALFALLGVTYGGNGVTTFALPDLRGRQAIGFSATNPPGQFFGKESVTLTAANLPVHQHQIRATTAPATRAVPQPDDAIATMQNGGIYTEDTASNSVIIAQTNPAGGGQPIPIQNPVLVQTWCINLSGIYPSRN